MSEAALLLLPGEPMTAISIDLVPAAGAAPRISCLMATRGHLEPARHAIDCFRRQSYPNRELVIACAGRADAIRRHVDECDDPRIRLIAPAGEASPGGLRNIAADHATGGLVCVWDDDDLSDPDRLTLQYGAMAAAGAGGCFLSRVLLWWPERRRLAASSRRIWENTMLVERGALPRYGSGDRGEDTAAAQQIRRTTPLVLIDRPAAYCYVAHGANIWPAEHFAMLFDHASERWDGAVYPAATRLLAARLPLADYAAGLGIAPTSAG